MQDERRSLIFNSEISNIQPLNASFDQGILRIAHWGANNNKTFIERQSFIDATPTMFNCPIVCNYSRETDSIGSHDMEIIKSSMGMKLVNLTHPVGVVPESAQPYWEWVDEDDGSRHEYLCTQILLWKRQEAYSHLKENGITSQSMEIRVKSGHRDDDELYHIDSFDFTAFCLLESAKPCFPSANIELFAYDEFKRAYSDMMADFRKEFIPVNTAIADDIGAPEGARNFSKGGRDSLDVNELMLRYGLTEQDIDFDTSGMDAEELEQRFAEIKASKDAPANASFEDDGDSGSEESGEDEDGEEGQSEDDDDDIARRSNFSLTGEQFVSELLEQLHKLTYTHPEWGELLRYGYVDYDSAVSEVYVYDYTDWKLYGFTYAMNGDNVVIDLDSKKRKKFAFVDFDMGSEQFCYKKMLDGMNSQFEKMSDELNDLREFKDSANKADREAKVAKLFAQFADLEGNENFEALKNDRDAMTMAELEDKCFAIRGRNVQLNFSQDTAPRATRIPVERNTIANEPYGGVFLKYGVGTR